MLSNRNALFYRFSPIRSKMPRNEHCWFQHAQKWFWEFTWDCLYFSIKCVTFIWLMTSCLRAAACKYMFYKPDVHRVWWKIQVAVPLKNHNIPKFASKSFQARVQLEKWRWASEIVLLPLKTSYDFRCFWYLIISLSERKILIILINAHVKVTFLQGYGISNVIVSFLSCTDWESSRRPAVAEEYITLTF